MNQTKVFETTQRVSQAPLEFTQKVMEQTNKLKHPSRRVSRIGSVVGAFIGVILLLSGTIGLLSNKEVWPVGTIISGLITILSNYINYNRK